jgi:hypothetical protein
MLFMWLSRGKGARILCELRRPFSETLMSLLTHPVAVGFSLIHIRLFHCDRCFPPVGFRSLDMTSACYGELDTAYNVNSEK